MEDRWRCGGSSGSSERDRLRVTERNPAPLPRPVQVALEPSERLFDGHLRNCARFQGSTSERRNAVPKLAWARLRSAAAVPGMASHLACPDISTSWFPENTPPMSGAPTSHEARHGHSDLSGPRRRGARHLVTNGTPRVSPEVSCLPLLQLQA